MKEVSADLNQYMNNEKHFQTCDLYHLLLADGNEYYIADYDRDLTYNGHKWEHNRGLFSRDQVKLSGEPSVDSMTITIAVKKADLVSGIPIMQACHDGVMSGAELTLYKAYFQADDTIVGSVQLFMGDCEVSSAGGLLVKLTCKSNIQGLAQQLPRRIFAPQGAYTTVNGVVTTSDADTTTMLVPLKPSQRVLVKL